jgi:hypothetical protein
MEKTAWTAVAEEYRDAGNFEEASKTTRRENLDPLDYQTACENIARTGKLDRALELCRQYKGSPDAVRSAAARVLIDQGMLDEAKSVLASIEDPAVRNPITELLSISKARSMMNKGDLDGAESIASTVGDFKFPMTVFDRRSRPSSTVR